MKITYFEMWLEKSYIYTESAYEVSFKCWASEKKLFQNILRERSPILLITNISRSVKEIYVVFVSAENMIAKRVAFTNQVHEKPLSPRLNFIVPRELRDQSMDFTIDLPTTFAKTYTDPSSASSNHSNKRYLLIARHSTDWCDYIAHFNTEFRLVRVID